MFLLLIAKEESKYIRKLAILCFKDILTTLNLRLLQLWIQIWTEYRSEA